MKIPISSSLNLAVFLTIIVPLAGFAQKASETLYVGTWPRQVLVIDEASGKVVDQLQLSAGTPQSLTLSCDKKKIYATTWNNGDLKDFKQVDKNELSKPQHPGSFPIQMGPGMIRTMTREWSLLYLLRPTRLCGAASSVLRAWNWPHAIWTSRRSGPL